MENLQNAKQFPKQYYCRHMQPGVCGYEDETILVDTAAIKKMLPSGCNMPVYVHHQSVDLERLNEEAVGYITDAFYNELDGWAWFKIIVTRDEGHAAIVQWGKVSNAYVPTQFGAGGTKNNVPYHREVLDAEFKHLAIVPNPRYEDADVFTPDQFRNYQEKLKNQLAEINNSKTTEPAKGNKMFKLFKNKKEEVTEVDSDTMLTVNGKDVSIGSMVTALENAKKNEKEDEEKEEKENAEPMCMVNGEEIPVSELVNRYNAMKKNSDDEEEEKKKKDAEAKENAKALELANARKVEEEKQNAKQEGDKMFEALLNAHTKSASSQSPVTVALDGVERGKSRYGSSK